MDIEDFWGKWVAVGGPDECWPYKGRGRNVNVNGVVISAPRLAYTSRVGKLPPDLLVSSNCGSTTCCNPAHLRAGTRRELQTLWTHRAKILSRSHLTPDDIREIRTSTLPGATLARAFKITRQAVSQIRQRKTWRHI